MRCEKLIAQYYFDFNLSFNFWEKVTESIYALFPDLLAVQCLRETLHQRGSGVQQSAEGLEQRRFRLKVELAVLLPVSRYGHSADVKCIFKQCKAKLFLPHHISSSHWPPSTT